MSTTELGSFYVGPGKPRLVLASWSDVEIAAAAGLLGETAWIELKREVPAASKAANRELAKDLASLSVDGGILIVGVADDHEVVGFGTDPETLKTRVVQVAGAAVNPPLFVDVDLILAGSAGGPADGTKPDLALAVIRVPASGSAPHMVDDNYWGRSAEGKRPLSDPEVERLMTSRRLRAGMLDDELHQIEADLGRLARNPAEHSHLSFYARPRGGARISVTEALEGHFAPQMLNESRDFRASWGPWSHLGAQPSHRPDGVLLSSDDPRFGMMAEEHDAYRILLRDDGAVLAVAGGVTHGMTSSRMEGEHEAIVCGYLLEGVHVLTHLAGYLAGEHLGYSADWEVGVLVTDLKGRFPTDWFTRGDLKLHAYPTEEFVGRTVASTREMWESPAAVVGRLMLPMLRSVGVARYWLPYERGEQIAERRAR